MSLETFSNRKIHEGKIIGKPFDISNSIKQKLLYSGFQTFCHLDGVIYPQLIYEFYQTFHLHFVNNLWIMTFKIEGKQFALSIKDFGVLLDLSFEGHCFYNNEWSLTSITNNNNKTVKDPFYTKLIHPSSIILEITKKRLNGYKYDINDPNKLFTDEICPYLKPIEIIIRENIFCSLHHDSRLHACEAYMIYCISSSTPFNLAHFLVNRINDFKNKSYEILPYGLLLSKLLAKMRASYPNPRNQTLIHVKPSSNPLCYKINEEIEDDFRCGFHHHHN